MTTKTALVTGASRGIGAAIAARLAADGFFVIGTATTEAGAQSISAALGEKGSGQTLVLQSADSVAALIENVGKLGDAPTVLVNNAGITRDNLLLRMGEDEWTDVIDTPFRPQGSIQEKGVKSTFTFSANPWKLIPFLRAIPMLPIF